MDRTRTYGVLMPIFSLPSEECVGTLGEGAFSFVEFLARAGAGIWQILPIGPTIYGNSPYQPSSATALNYYFIDLKALKKDGLLTDKEYSRAASVENRRRVDYGRLFTEKTALLRLAYSRCDMRDEEFRAFIKDGKYFDFAVYSALKVKFSHKAFFEWDPPYNAYDETTVNRFAIENKDEINFWQFTQYVFLKQWARLKRYANANGIKIMGDISFYLAPDCVELWKEGDDLFKVDSSRRSSLVAGCPPDAFSADGQLWGNPVYDWEKAEKNGYAWWRNRISYSLSLFDYVRIDHFRAFDRFFAVPAGDKNARRGVWIKAPGEKIFDGFLDKNIIAEDLCLSDEGVVRLMKNVGYPGMKILQHAFDGNVHNEHRPSSYSENTVCYTGTHDNSTLKEHYLSLDGKQREIYRNALRDECYSLGVHQITSNADKVCASVISLGFASKAFAFIIPMWDVLRLDGEARMNFPSAVEDKNWSYRFMYGDYGAHDVAKLKNYAKKYHRYNG